MPTSPFPCRQSEVGGTHQPLLCFSPSLRNLAAARGLPHVELHFPEAAARDRTREIHYANTPGNLAVGHRLHGRLDTVVSVWSRACLVYNSPLGGGVSLSQRRLHGRGGLGNPPSPERSSGSGLFLHLQAHCRRAY